MGFIKSNLFISLDGVIESPETWHFPYFDDQMGAVVNEQMSGNDATLIGRQTYDEFCVTMPNDDRLDRRASETFLKLLPRCRSADPDPASRPLDPEPFRSGAGPRISLVATAPVRRSPPGHRAGTL